MVDKMDWKEIITLKPDKITEDNRTDVFQGIIQFRDFDRADGKSFRKLFKISHKLMHWKNEEVSGVR